MEEIWKDVIGYEGIYQVSNLGRVKSLSRIIFNRGINPFISKEKILKGANCEYRNVVLAKNGINKSVRIHKLVAIHFLNHTPCGYDLVINHKDLNKLNNSSDNLEIVSNRDNCNKKHIVHTSKYTGVNWNKSANKWMSGIKINGKRKHLGYFINEYDAYLAYQKELKKLQRC